MFAKEHEDEENKFDICIKVDYFVFFCVLYKITNMLILTVVAYMNNSHTVSFQAYTVHKTIMLECWLPGHVENNEQY